MRLSIHMSMRMSQYTHAYAHICRYDLHGYGLCSCGLHGHGPHIYGL